MKKDFFLDLSNVIEISEMEMTLLYSRESVMKRLIQDHGFDFSKPIYEDHDLSRGVYRYSQ